MLQRLITGVFFLAIVITCIFWGYFQLIALMAVVTFIGTIEYYNLVLKGGAKPNMILGSTLAMVVYVLLTWRSFPFKHDELLYLVPAVLVLCIFLVEMLKLKELPFNNIVHALFPSFFIAVPFAFMIKITKLNAAENYQPVLLLIYLGVIWTYDTFAYLTGRTFGKHKLAESVSPKKTWEGAVGGLSAGIGYILIMAHYWPFGIGLVQWTVFAVLVMITGTLGDLSVSLLKRSVSAKDTGAVLPGHGGILDRFDSELLSAGVAYLYLLHCLT